MKVKSCVDCGVVIDPERLEVLPSTVQCISCARVKPQVVKYNLNEVCAQASESARNGFAKSS